jgi:hypothetical protein
VEQKTPRLNHPEPAEFFLGLLSPLPLRRHRHGRHVPDLLGEILGVTESRVCQIHTKAVGGLRIQLSEVD